MRKGEVWQVRIPPAPGHGQTGQRPAVVLQEDLFIAFLPTLLIVPFTSTSAAARFDGTLIVQPDSQNGLAVASVALVFQLRALDKRNCLLRLGVLDPADLDKIFTLMDRLNGR